MDAEDYPVYNENDTLTIPAPKSPKLVNPPAGKLRGKIRNMKYEMLASSIAVVF